MINNIIFVILISFPLIWLISGRPKEDRLRTGLVAISGIMAFFAIGACFNYAHRNDKPEEIVKTSPQRMHDLIEGNVVDNDHEGYYIRKRCIREENHLDSHMSWNPLMGWHYSYDEEPICVEWEYDTIIDN